MSAAFRRFSGNCYRRTILGREALTEHRHTIIEVGPYPIAEPPAILFPTEPGLLNLQLRFKIEAQVSRRFALITTTPGKHAHRTTSSHRTADSQDGAGR